jgi:hypothetical protein
MATKRVVKFQSSDGELHDSLTEANLHEAKKQLQIKLKHDILQPAFVTGRPDAIILAIVESVPELIEALRPVHAALLNHKRSRGQLYWERL